MDDDQFFRMLFVSISRSELDNAVHLRNRTKASLLLWFSCLTACVTRKWAGVDTVWEREKLEARKKLEKRADSHLSGARCVRRFHFNQPRCGCERIV